MLSKDRVYLQTDPQKIVAIKEWPAPKTITQLRSFLGMAAEKEDLSRIMGSIFFTS